MLRTPRLRFSLSFRLRRKFNLINPRSRTLSFKWRASKNASNNISLFKCLTPDGAVTGGRMSEMVFSFLPNGLGTFEELYEFKADGDSEGGKILLVGRAKEPCVYFSQPLVDLRPTLVGINVSDHVGLINSEGEDYEFRILKDTLYTQGREHRLQMSPSKGYVKAGEELRIR